MLHHGKHIVDEDTRRAVLEAFEEARSAGGEAFTCYRAAVDAWLARHPDHDRTYAARRAIEIVQQSFGSLRDMVKE